MASSADLHQLADGDFIWQSYDPAVKADLFSTGLKTPAGVYLIDPIPLAEDELRDALGGSKVAGTVVTNANHRRDAAAFAQKLSASIYARAGTYNETPDVGVTKITGGATQMPGLEVLIIDGAAAGEIALFRADSRGGTLVVGDAVINSGSYGFTLLPAKYCNDPKLLRKSLRQLLDHRFERIFFAHGTPILAGGRARLEALLESVPK